MSFELLIDYATLLAFAAFTIELLIKIIYLWRHGDAHDISATSMLIRILAISILTVKFIALQDPWLIIGQSVLLVVILFYAVMVLRCKYFESKK